MSAPPLQPVFISYAHEDAPSARVIAEQLRRAGFEVWFDEHELKGGEAWNKKIRDQIASCSLFVPIISPNTEARAEGYFRREWRQAVERSEDIAEGIPFIVPVCLGEVAESAALVPRAFTEVQWIRVRQGGLADSSVANIQQLLNRKITTRAATRASSAPSVDPVEFSAPKPVRGRLPIGAAVALLVLVAAVFAWRQRTAAVVPAATASTTASKPAITQSNGAKTIAVLPFSNLSGNADHSYFSDGISEELLNVLAKIPDLQVAARSSAFSFQGKAVSARQIAHELGVDHLVEGSVQREGQRVKVFAKLINAKTGFQMWGDRYDYELRDIFKLQEEIAGAIARSLRVSLGGVSRATKRVNPVAHESVLQGRHHWRLRSAEELRKAEAAYQAALAVDSDYADAYAGLALTYILTANNRFWAGDEGASEDLTRTAKAANTALSFDPNSSEAFAALAYSHHMNGQLELAEQNYKRALEISPNSALFHYWLGLLRCAQGRIGEALREYEFSRLVDPLDPTCSSVYAQDLSRAKRYGDALKIAERVSTVTEGKFLPTWSSLARAQLGVGQREQALRSARFIVEHPEMSPRWNSDVNAIWILCQLGADDIARKHAEALKDKYPADSYMTGLVKAALGDFDGAVPLLRKIPVSHGRGLLYDSMWDRWRETPQFMALIAELGRKHEYLRARSELAGIANAR